MVRCLVRIDRCRNGDRRLPLELGVSWLFSFPGQRSCPWRFRTSCMHFQKQSRQSDHPFDARQATPPAMSPDKNNASHLRIAAPHFSQSQERWIRQGGTEGVYPFNRLTATIARMPTDVLKPRPHRCQKQSAQLDHPFDARQARPPAMFPDTKSAPQVAMAPAHVSQLQEGWTPLDMGPVLGSRRTAEA